MKLTDATAIKVGAANASAVYLGSTKLWPVSAASAGAPMFISGAADYAYPGISSIPIPASAQAGDLVLITGSSSTSGNAITVSGGTQLLAPTNVIGSKYLVVYSYVLTAEDIANGNFAAAVTYTYAIGIWRDAEVHVIGTIGSGGIYEAITADGITTTVDHTSLVAVFNATTNAPSLVTTPYPTGWSVAAESVTSTSYLSQMLYFDDSTPAGATGDVAFNQSQSRWQSFMLSLKSI